MNLNERILDSVFLVQGERVAEFILPLLSDDNDWTLVQLVLTRQLPDDSDWSALPSLVGFDPSLRLGHFNPILWRVLARLGHHDYEWTCQQIKGAAQSQNVPINDIITGLHGFLMYELHWKPKLELDRADFTRLLRKALGNL